MNEETVIKYLEFLKMECLRHSNDKLINESELQLFKLEVDKFKSLLKKSKLESKIKRKINNINFDLSLPKYKGLNLLAYFTGSQWSNSKLREEIMGKKFKKISEQIEITIFEIKSIL